MKKVVKITFYALGIITLAKAAKYVLNKNKQVKKIKQEMAEKDLISINESEEKNKKIIKRNYILLKQVKKEEL